MLSLRQAEVLRAVMVTGSIVGAARMLNVSAPGISRMIRHIEEAHGVRLFLRSGRGLSATADARALFDNLEVIHNRLERINRHLAESRNDGVGDYAVGCSPGLSHALIPAAMADLRRRYPALNLTLDVLHVDELVPAILTRRVNMALAIYPVDDKRVVCSRLAEAGLVCLVPASSRLASKTMVTPSDLEGEPLIGFERSVFQNRLVGGVFQAAKIAPDFSIRVRLMSSAIPLVQEGLGCAILDAFTVGRMAPERTCAVPFASDVRIPLMAIRDAHDDLDPTSRRFQDCVVTAALASGALVRAEARSAAHRSRQ